MMTFFAILGIAFSILLYLAIGFFFGVATIDENHSFYEWLFNKIYALCVKKDPEHFYCETYMHMKVYYWSPEEENYRKLIESHPFIKKLQLIVDSAYFFLWPIFLVCELLYELLNRK